MNKKLLGALIVFAILVVAAGVALNANKKLDSNQLTVDSSKHNELDVMFAQMMIPHHEQAIEMSTLAETRATSQEVKQLAAEIKKAQDPEIQTLRGWLKSWGKTDDIPVSNDPGHSGHDMGATVAGMMTVEDMDKLKAANGPAFDKMFLTMMIEHHRGAVDMAKTELSTGQYGPAKELASKIISAQEAEITKMNELLKRFA